jgi:2-polyprenyl-3-methyl-5-hydroxy-6-metoxy-1,4-benzoquinol methylase/GNAT superfamily N-acetyltransferase
MYQFTWIPGRSIATDLLGQMALLYSEHYGTWGEEGPHPGQKVRLSPERIREGWLSHPDSRVAYATAFGELVGYAIAVQVRVPRRGTVTWVTQLVVHEAHRRTNVGKILLFTLWQFTDHFAWGLITANPYAVRALEKATRRRCSPSQIALHKGEIADLGTQVVPYMDASTLTIITETESRIFTKFFLDHAGLTQMLTDVTGPEKPWCLGPLQEGWEWLAFTLRSQQQIQLSGKEVEQMLLASEAVTKEAYSRMLGEHPWARHARSEASFIVENCLLAPGDRVLDFGCGTGRHAIELASMGIEALGIDYISSVVSNARQKASSRALQNAMFEVADCRSVEMQGKFNAGLCVYDVIGSYAEERDNRLLLQNLASYIKEHGFILLSVMNLELTERRAKNWFSIHEDPDKLLSLPPSNTMEKTGDVFNPDFYLIDRDTKLVYRKEQFFEGDSLPEELVVRDRRYTKDQIENLCRSVNLEVVWSRFVRAGKWSEPLDRNDDRAKEILVLCKKPSPESDLLFS